MNNTEPPKWATRLIRVSGMVMTKPYTFDYWYKDGGSYIMLLQYGNAFATVKKMDNPEFIKFWRNRGVTLREL